MLQTSKGSNSSSTSSSRSASISTATPNTIVEDEELLCDPKSELTPPAVANPLRPVSKSILLWKMIQSRHSPMIWTCLICVKNT